MCRSSAIGGVTSLISLLAITVLSVSPRGATPLAGSSANVVWPTRTAGAMSASGVYICGTTVRMTATTGFANSSVGFPVSWSTLFARNAAFVNGIWPNRAHTSAGFSVALPSGTECTAPFLTRYRSLRGFQHVSLAEYRRSHSRWAACQSPAHRVGTFERGMSPERSADASFRVLVMRVAGRRCR